MSHASPTIASGLAIGQAEHSAQSLALAALITGGTVSYIWIEPRGWRQRKNDRPCRLFAFATCA